MTIRIKLLPLLAALPFTTQIHAATPALSGIKQTESATRYIIQFEKNSHAIQTTQTLAALNISPLRQLTSINAVVATLTPEQRNTLETNSDIALIEPDPVRYLQDDQTPYGITRVQAPLLSDVAVGNQKVCIIDTGYDLGHEDLMSGPHVTGEIVDSINGQADLGVWSEDNYGHGTHIAGIISSVDNNFALVGVNPGNRLNLHNVKIIHNPHYWKIWGSDMIAAVEACTTAGATVINMSIGGQDSSEAERQAMQTAYDNGSLLFAAAGNRGSSDYFYPASYDSVVSVGAIDENGVAWRYTQSNDKTELVAPGVEVKSTLPGNLYGKKDGTSVATAFASGVAALVWSHYPQCSARQIREVLTTSANDLGDAGQDLTYGFGEIQAKAALDLLDARGCSESVPVMASCQAIVDAGYQVESGMYQLDLDGPEGPMEVIDAYCDMEHQGGGWTLFANHRHALQQTEANSVTPDEFNVYRADIWRALRDQMSSGMMFIDEKGVVSRITKERLAAGNCRTPDLHDDLMNTTSGYLWHYENSGCSGSGQDYSLINIGPQAVYGASIYNLAASKFDVWGYGSAGASYGSQQEMLYFIK